MTRRKLRDKFEEFGTISDIKIPLDRLGVSKNFAFIRFTGISNAQEARRKLHRTIWDGRYLIVRYKNMVNEDGSNAQEHTTPLALEPPSPEIPSSPKAMREIKADQLDEKVIPKPVYERTSEDFMTLSTHE
jgi:RNA recognition motif-containing protein